MVSFVMHHISRLLPRNSVVVLGEVYFETIETKETEETEGTTTKLSIKKLSVVPVVPVVSVVSVVSVVPALTLIAKFSFLLSLSLKKARTKPVLASLPPPP